MSQEAFRLNGKVVVLTGAGGIIGRVATRMLREAGGRVLALDRSVDDLHSIGEEDDTLMKRVVDVTDSHALVEARLAMNARWGNADVLVNNAAAKSKNFFEPFDTFPLADWNEVLDVNLTGAMLCAQVFGPPMVEQRHGVIINTLSIYGIVGPDQRIYDGSEYLGRAINTPAVYSASKAALWGLTKYLATYWGGHGVRTNAVTPGGISSGQNSTFTEKYESRVPMGRMACAEDIAYAMVYLSSDAARYINGHNLVVDGGWTAW